MLGLAGAELRWPFVRRDTRATHVIAPVAQLVFSDTLGDVDVPNEDSALPELDETNLFSANRFPGLDRRETGLRLNAGLTYTRIDPTGWEIGATVGRVLRTEENPAFPPGSGLGGRRSDWVVAASFDTADGLGLIESRYRVRPNWDIEAEWRYDIAAGRSIFAAGGLTYGNECIETSVVVSRRFTSVNNVPQDTRVAVELRLAGLGSGPDRDWPARRCRGI